MSGSKTCADYRLLLNLSAVRRASMLQQYMDTRRYPKYMCPLSPVMRDGETTLLGYFVIWGCVGMDLLPSRYFYADVVMPNVEKYIAVVLCHPETRLVMCSVAYVTCDWGFRRIVFFFFFLW